MQRKHCCYVLAGLAVMATASAWTHAEPTPGQADAKQPAPAQAPAQAPTPLEWIFGDIKLPLHGQEDKNGNPRERITPENYRAVVDGLKRNLHCNGLRVYIDPDIEDPARYPKLYQDVLAYARQQNLALYANPLNTGHLESGRYANNKRRYARWVGRYANHYRPEFLGPFNESSGSSDEKVKVARLVRKELAYSPKLVGPDMMHLRSSIDECRKHAPLIQVFDIIGSHNAAGDEQATAEAWRSLRHRTNKPTWATENPRPLSAKGDGGREIGVRAVLDSRAIQGLILYKAFPACVNADGSLTDKGREIEPVLRKS